MKITFKAPYACFTRPELKTERVSYDCLTPSAARNMLQAIYWKPSLEYSIKTIAILVDIEYVTLKRNEVSIRASSKEGIFIENERTQRNSLLLKDVAYIVDFNINLTDKAGCNLTGKATSEELENDRNIGKHLAILTDRITNGKCFMQPYMGCREFSASFALTTAEDEKQIKTDIDRNVGLMLRDIEVKKVGKKEEYIPLFFRAKIDKGILTVPPIEEALR
jgi:CRISPR-associated protein Cas5d